MFCMSFNLFWCPGNKREESNREAGAVLRKKVISQ